MPSLSRTGRLGFVSGLLLATGGLALPAEALLGAGQGLLAGLALAWVATLPLPRRLRRERLEFTWWISTRARGPRRPEEPLPLRIALKNPTDTTLILSAPRLALSPGLEHLRASGHRVVVPPRSVATLELELRAQHVGRLVLHGAWMSVSGPFGLAWAPLYFPNPLPLDIQPRGAGAALSRRAHHLEAARAAPGGARPRRGEGPELHELRDFRPGDPYKRIAWKPSARRGRLLVRETEDETRSTQVLLLDASATMRGEGGGTRLDYGIEMVAQGARRALQTGDPFGLVAFASRVLETRAPSNALGPLQQLVDCAVGLRSLADEDLTELDEEELLALVARYLREQDGVDVLRGRDEHASRQKLSELVTRALREDPLGRQRPRARDPLQRLLRAFCRARGLNLPLRHDATGAERLAGLRAALRVAAAQSREPRRVLLLSDLETLSELHALRTEVALLRQRQGKLLVIAPAGESFLGYAGPENVPASLAAQREAVRAALLADEALRLTEARRAWAAMGVPMYTARKVDPLARWLLASMRTTASTR